MIPPTTDRPNCPKCSQALKRVRKPSDSYLNDDQFDSQKAGDWYCTSCVGSRAGSGFRYYWESELSSPTPAPAGTGTATLTMADVKEYASAYYDYVRGGIRPDAEARAVFDAVSKKVSDRLATLTRQLAEAQQKADAYDRINTPEIDDFLSAVRNEALHQRERWGIDQDGGKTDAEWFWLVGYLAGKALHDVKGKRLHHIITAAAALLNWHGHAIGAYARMRPGIENPD